MRRWGEMKQYEDVCHPVVWSKGSQIGSMLPWEKEQAKDFVTRLSGPYWVDFCTQRGWVGILVHKPSVWDKIKELFR